VAIDKSWEFVGVSSLYTGITEVGQSLPKPAGFVAGDKLILIMCKSDNAANQQTPSGYTKVNFVGTPFDLNNERLRVCQRTAWTKSFKKFPDSKLIILHSDSFG